jgi:acyl-CoA dehydrogenase
VISAATLAAETTSDVARRLSEDVLAVHAGTVDAEARFPVEAVQALRRERLLGMAVPGELGGMGADVAELAAVTTELARGCASTAMIFAMHQIQVLSLVRHGRSPLLREFAGRVATEELLLASATTEIGIGGDVRTSGCAVEHSADGRRVSLTKTAPVISYGSYADGVLATARRDSGAGPSDQVLLVCAHGPGDRPPVAGPNAAHAEAAPGLSGYTGDPGAGDLAGPSLRLEQLSDWDTLGMRGTCSNGFTLTADCPAGYLMDDPYEVISAATMLPVSHLLWASVWRGIARQAESVARRFVQAESRRKVGTTPPSALRLAELAVPLQRLEATVQHALAGLVVPESDPAPTPSSSQFDAPDAAGRGAGTELGVALDLNTLKVSASELVIEVVGQALAICGINGYRNDSPYSLARPLRDALGATVMISNERVLHNNAQLLLGVRDR